MINIGASTTAASQSWPTWSDNVLVNAAAIPSTTTVYITTDGSTASASNFTDALQGGKTAIVSNGQPKLGALQYAGSGGLNMHGNPTGNGLTVQSVPGALWTSGHPTVVSVVLSTGTGSVGVEQR